MHLKLFDLSKNIRKCENISTAIHFIPWCPDASGSGWRDLRAFKMRSGFDSLHRAMFEQAFFSLSLSSSTFLSLSKNVRRARKNEGECERCQGDEGKNEGVLKKAKNERSFFKEVTGKQGLEEKKMKKRCFTAFHEYFIELSMSVDLSALPPTVPKRT